ncbi:PREDICTED: uncharacterized protein LOC104813830 [Tarenaya hassleriana]|uniref:uncharacterized protein LOC104813830 n=1 Tax=Tarenaya hassleriana TaxID=28532 RepID=UPI00053C657A|nr:PREDICTED: uncharacterized protein LOC104813830 [Tarenaya hassleriana]
MAQTLSNVSLTASMAMLMVLLSTNIGSAKGKTDCKGVADNLHHFVHENCRDGPTSMCGAYCFMGSGGDCTGKCADRKCSCFPNCDRIFTQFYFRPSDVWMPPRALCQYKNPDGNCSDFCKRQSGGNCSGRCTTHDINGCKCFLPA